MALLLLTILKTNHTPNIGLKPVLGVFCMWI